MCTVNIFMIESTKCNERCVRIFKVHLQSKSVLTNNFLFYQGTNEIRIWVSGNLLEWKTDNASNLSEINDSICGICNKNGLVKSMISKFDGGIMNISIKMPIKITNLNILILFNTLFAAKFSNRISLHILSFDKKIRWTCINW